MDKLKDFIQDNIEDFEDNLLPEGHFERFEKKLPHEQKRRLSLFRLSALAAAASVALFFLLRTPGKEQEDHMMALSQEMVEREEMNELQIYYRMQMDNILLQMETLSKQQSEGTTGLLQASKQILHDNSIFEKTILPTLPCSGEGVLAMNQHYSASVEGLNIVLRLMEQVTSETNE